MKEGKRGGERKVLLVKLFFLRRGLLINLISFVLLISLAFSPVMAQNQIPVISVSPASIEASHGDTFTVEITVDPKGSDIYGVQYDLYFDNSMLKAQTQKRGAFLSQDGVSTMEIANVINNTFGKLEYCEFRTDVDYGVTNSDVLTSIPFEVTGTSGTSDLKLSNVILTSSSIEIISDTELKSGECIIGEVTGEPAATPTGITVDEAKQMLAEEPAKIILLDARTEEEYNAEHIQMSGIELINIPLSELENRISDLDELKKIIAYSEADDESKRASEILVQQGFDHVYNMLGGIEAWKVKFQTSITTPMTVAQTPTPATSPTSTSSSPATVTTPMTSPSPPKSEEKRQIPGFEVTFAIAAIAIWLGRKRRRNLW